MESFLHGLNSQSNMYGDKTKAIPSKQIQNIPALSASQKPKGWLCAHILFYFWTRLHPNLKTKDKSKWMLPNGQIQTMLH